MQSLWRLKRGVRWMTQPYAFLDDAFEEHGLTFNMDLPVMGKAFVTGDPALIREIASHPQLQAGAAVPAIRALLGENSLIALDGAGHTQRRRIVAPVFRENLQGFDSLAMRVTSEVLRETAVGTPCSIYEPLRRISLLVILHAMFGEDRHVVAEGFNLVDKFLHSFSNPLVLFLRPLRTDLGRFSPWGKAMRNRRDLLDFIQQRIALHEAGSPDAEHSMLSRILKAASGAGICHEALQQEILALLLFGHDTGAAALSWAVVHLLQQPEHIEVIRRETRSGSVDDWKHLRCCLSESLRLCPVVPHLSRKAATSLQLSGHSLKANQTVIPATYLAHHNPLVFPQPHEFRPQRFMNEAPPAHAFFPFGVGDRTCVGKPFVMRQMMLILAGLFKERDAELAPGYRPAAVRRLLLITPRQGGMVVLRDVKEKVTATAEKCVAGGTCND